MVGLSAWERTLMMFGGECGEEWYQGGLAISQTGCCGANQCHSEITPSVQIKIRHPESSKLNVSGGLLL